MKLLYHVSEVCGLTVLKPKVSSHGKAYVYAIENLVAGLLFGAKWDDFDFLMTNDEAGRPVLYECYLDAFEGKYAGKSCSVYEVEEAGFQKGVTGWEPELVCEREVPVQREVAIDDLHDRLLVEEIQGNLILHRYRDEIPYKRRIAEHIVDRLIRFDALGRLETDERFRKHYGRIIGALRAAMDGHLLD